MEGLFTTADMQEWVGDSELPGYRLLHVQILNWGTFNNKVWSFTPEGDTSLLTGDVGSGKSTLVDAVTTLLMPPHKIAYNKAAGAETKERDPRSYVLGYYTRQRDGDTDISKPVPLRDGSSYTVILGVFGNAAFEETVSLAVVFWMPEGKSGQPERRFVVAERALDIADDFSDFGTRIQSLFKRLEAGGARTYKSYPEYGKDLRRSLGIPSAQALELFHQTVSMKSVGNLTDFVRQHMLEEFNVKEKVAELVEHFDHLNTAHERVRQAREQLARLEPLLKDCAYHDKVAGQRSALEGQRDALAYFFARYKKELLDNQIVESADFLEQAESQLGAADVAERQANQRRDDLIEQRSGDESGRKLAEVQRRIADEKQRHVERRARADTFAVHLAEAQLAPVSAGEEFPGRLREIDQAGRTTQERYSELQTLWSDADYSARSVKAQLDEIDAELRDLHSRPSNIPADREKVRRRMSEELGIAVDEMPFVGELVRVRPDSAQWEGAAERALHGFGVSILVAPDHYSAVSAWVDGNDLKGQIRYFQIPEVPRPVTKRRDSGATILADKLDVKAGPFGEWLTSELSRRADHVCADSLAELRSAPRAITRAGQLKVGRGQHEKDDRFAIGDRRWYVLGWSNEAKISALTAQQSTLTRTHLQAVEHRDELLAEQSAISTRRQALAKLSTYTSWSDLDWEASVRRIGELEQEAHDLQALSQNLQRLNNEIEKVESKLREVRVSIKQLTGDAARVTATMDQARRDLELADALVRHPDYDVAESYFPELDKRMSGPVDTDLPQLDAANSRLFAELNSLINEALHRQTRAANTAVNKMRDFAASYPLETQEIDSDIDSAQAYRQLYKRLESDDLPKFEEDFKRRLNENTIKDIAGFLAELKRNEYDVRERISIINDSLAGIDYDPGRYIALQTDRTVDQQVLSFIHDLKACTDDALDADPDDQYSEAKFAQVQAIIERFKGREGHPEDQDWTRKVADVRNWFTFSASSRWKLDNSEYEHFTDSSGKSGGQKEKLAYTVLAASLAYQFKLEWGVTRSKAFRFVVIDEAFGRGSEASARYGLELFARLGLQLMVVTPLQKIHVIEPFVTSVGYVDNPTGKNTRIQNMTIKEYRERHDQQRAKQTETRVSVVAPTELGDD